MITISADATIEKRNTVNNFFQQTLNAENQLINNGSRSVNMSGDNYGINNAITWNRRLAKAGRTLSLNLSQNYERNKSQGIWSSENKFYRVDLSDSIVNVDQLKTNQSNIYNLHSKLLYTEPLSQTSTLGVNYGFTMEESKVDLKSYNKNNDTYSMMDSLTSSNYEYKQGTHNTGISYNLVKDKTQISIGSDLAFVRLSQYNHFTGSSFFRNYMNVKPQLRFRYSFENEKRLTISYSGQNQLPSITQLQPINNNDDPLNIYIGNPNLDPSFKHSFGVIYRDFKPLAEQTFLINGQYNINTNPIILNLAIDNYGKNTYSYLNVNYVNSSSFNLYVLYSKKVKSINANLDVNTQLNLTKDISFTNGILNTLNGNTYSVNIGIAKRKTQKYEASLNAMMNYSAYKNSVNSTFNNDFFSYRLSPNVDLYIGGLQFHTDANYNWQQKTSIYYGGFNQFIWNFWISEKVFKDKITLKASANDILNQNSGFNRFSNNNSFTQTSYNTIRRNFMVTVGYDINKTFGK